jgi:hypothetical protein
MFELQAIFLDRELRAPTRIRRVYFFGCAVGGSSPLSRRYIAAEL